MSLTMAGTSNVKNPNENKKRRRSKKSKTSWRKHTDVKDVDSFLEEKGLEERLGGPVSEKPDGELFCVDKEPAALCELVNLFSSKAAKRKALKSKPVKSFALLKPHSAVKDPISKRNRVRTVEERHPTATKIKTLRKSRGILTKKEQQAIKNRAVSKAQKVKEKEEKGSAVKTDLWEEMGNSVISTEDAEWMYKTTLVHALKNTRSMKWQVPSSIHEKLSVAPVIEAPHPGISYNPSFLDHQSLLEAVVDTEKKIIKKEKHLQRVTDRMFSRVSGVDNAKNWMSEMSEGLPNQEEKEVNSGSDDDGDYKAINPPAKNAKKPLQKRRKIKEAKVELVARKRAKEEKKKMSDIHRLSVVKSELNAQEEKRQMLREKREKVKAIKKLQTRQLSSTKFEEPDLDFTMGIELSGNLRSINPVGNLIQDRYKSLQKRNIIAPTRGIQMIKRSKVKKFEKSTYKMGWEPKGF